MERRSLTKKNLLITGRPGVGKTTVMVRIAEALEELHPVGFFTREIRVSGAREGFELISLDGRKEILSHRDVKSPYRVGKYGVDVDRFDEFLATIPFLGSDTPLILLDEIGKMECLSRRFQSLVVEILGSDKTLIATVAVGGTAFMERIKARKDVQLFEITLQNRDTLHLDLLRQAELSTEGPALEIEVTKRMGERIKVIAYSGYRGEETPRVFLIHGERIEVVEIERRWTEEEAERGPRRRFFRVRGSDGRRHELHYDEEAMAWHYGK